jgi:two-component system CheB/CheR fusion protein
MEMTDGMSKDASKENQRRRGSLGGMEPAAEKSCRVVGIGASAGGQDALKEFFTAVPPDCAHAFVVIMHLPPSGTTFLAEMLGRYTPMRVLTAEEGEAPLPNTIHVLPADRELTLCGGRFRLKSPEKRRGAFHPVDRFFCSLASEAGERAIAVILSGSGIDGAEGAKAVKEAGGVVFVQEPDSAVHPAMPRSVIAAGAADLALPAEGLAEKIADLATRVCSSSSQGCHTAILDEDLAAVFALVKARTGHDFSSYKRNTVIRRIERRMAVSAVTDIRQYIALLETNEQEAHAVGQEILIGVTSFFRDPEAFEALRREIIPQLFANRDSDEPVRIWHACCATGEEVYSTAILIREYLDEQRSEAKVLLFATDIDETAIAQARTGLYGGDIEAAVGAERLRAFFTRVEGRWQVAKSLREMVVFAHHSLIKDPPFSRLDLMVCRNFLIYLNPDMQKRLISLFHLVLKPGGFLFLGAAETVERQSNLFTPLDKKSKLFKRRQGNGGKESNLPFRTPTPRFPKSGFSPRPTSSGEAHPGQIGEKLIMERYSPPWVVVNEKYDVVHVATGANRFLEVPAGGPTQDILKMIRAELRPPLRAAIYKTFADRKPVIFRGVRVALNGEDTAVNVLVEPLSAPPQSENLALVVLEPGVLPAPRLALPGGQQFAGDEASDEMLHSQLEEQLRITHEQLLAVTEQLETSQEGFMSANEELMSINEEFQSANEELQSTNEELETSKEELQSLNEELVTVNAELQGKVEELDRANSDMENLFNSSGVATIFLDRQLTIRRFSPAMASIFNLIHSDVGRPFRHLAGTIDWTGLPEDARSVLAALSPVEREVATLEGGRHFLMRVLPYRTSEGSVDGVVVTLVDITERKRAEDQVRSTALFPEENPFPIMRVTRDRVLQYANRASEELLSLWQCSVGEAVPEFLRRELEAALKDGANRELEIQCGECELSFVLVPIMERGYVNLYGRDITERNRAELSLQSSLQKFELLTATAEDLLRAAEPQKIVESLCRKVMAQLDCHAFFNFLVDEQAGRLHLNSCAGIPEEEARRIEWLDYGVAVSGCVARDGCRIVAEHIQTTPDDRTELVKSYGIKAYACHPLLGQDGQLAGTLSFGTRSRETFSEDDLSLMKAIADQVAVAMIRMKNKQALSESEERYRHLVQHANSAIIRWKRDGAITFFNEYAQAFFGYPADEVVGRHISILLPQRESTGNDLTKLIQDILDHPERYQSNDNENVCRDGRRVWMTWTNKPSLGADGRVEEILAVGSDITERKLAEEAREATIEMLRICNLAASTRELMRHLTVFFQRFSGCEAVGVRLQEGNDFPYYETCGFSEEFVQAENSLCVVDQNAEQLRDHAGQPILDCMCGSVLRGRFDPSRPFFTPQGSFWTGHTSELLASTTEADRQARTRNRCNGEGYESVALIPLRQQDEIFGLFQFNDRRRRRFTAGKIAQLESLVDYVAIALAKLKTEEELEESSQFNQQIINSAGEGVIVYDRDLRYRVWNPYMEKLMGLPADKILGQLPQEIFPYLQDTGLIERLELAKAGNAPAPLEFAVNSSTGGFSGWCLDTSAPLRNTKGEIVGVIGTVQDISERKGYEQELEYQASHDPLTGLANRNLLNDRLAQNLIYADRSQRIVAVLLLDLDRFKLVNDSLGHSHGDELLRMVAARLNFCVRPGDTVSRLGGDEFVVSLAEVAEVDDVGMLAKRIREALAQPFPLEGPELRVTTSIGISIYPKDGDNAETLLRHADIAMYRAKEEGGDSFRFFSADMNLRIQGTLELEADLSLALRRGEFELHYQPKVDIASGLISGCEALVRWRHPQRGLVSPAAFIPLAEETGLIVPLGEWVLREACAQARLWQEAGLPPMKVAVNLSARQFYQTDLVELVQSTLEKSGQPPSILELELTESMIMHEPASAVETMRHLKNLGVSLSLDDFGTGYSSLNYLRRFPVDHLKIDRSFIVDVTSDASAAAMATSVVAIAHSLGIKAVAEGVETREQLELLAACRCDAFQGYLFSKPLPPEEFVSLLQEGRSLDRR